MYRNSFTLRSWLLAAFCSAAAFTYSCQQKADIPEPTTAQVRGNAIQAQELSALQQAFTASGYAAALQEISLDGKSTHSWQPQWKAAFREDGAVFIPLLLSGKTLANAKYFLVSQNGLFSLGLYVLPIGQQAEPLGDAPAFLRQFTGQLEVRQLKTKRSRFYLYKQGQWQRRISRIPSKDKKSVGSKTQGCVTTTTCLWEATCGGNIVYLSMSESTGGACPEPEVDGLCRAPEKPIWSIYRSTGTVECGEDIPDEPSPVAPPEVSDGVYRITAVNSGLVLATRNGSTADGTQVIQDNNQNYNSQIWFVKSSFITPPYQATYWLYTLAPYNNYLEEEANPGPDSPVFGYSDRSMGILEFDPASSTYVQTNAAGALAKIWRRSTSTATGNGFYPGTNYMAGNTLHKSPFGWYITPIGQHTAGGTSGMGYIVANAYSGQSLNVLGVSTVAGHNLGQWPWEGYPIPSNVKFIFTKLF